MCTSLLKVESGHVAHCYIEPCLPLPATDEIAKKLEEAGLIKEQLLTDHRLQVNRGRQLKMYRVWIQARYSYPTKNRTEDE